MFETFCVAIVVSEIITILLIKIVDIKETKAAEKAAVTIPASITTISRGAFRGCTGLTAVTIPEGVTKIGEGAFIGCTGLTAVTIPEGVTTIEDYAFQGCTGLTAVTFPDSMTKIGNWAFEGCTGLTAVIPKGVTKIEEEETEEDDSYW